MPHAYQGHPYSIPYQASLIDHITSPHRTTQREEGHKGKDQQHAGDKEYEGIATVYPAKRL
jgi:hypothetical protein